MSFNIRPAEPRDCPAIAGLIKELAIYEKLGDQAKATAEDIERELFGPNPVPKALVAETPQGIVGFALYFYNFSTFTGRPGVYLEDLFVQPEHRGKGIGKQLFIEVGKVAQINNFTRLEWAVLDWNEPSIDFYKAFGAKAMADWTTYRLDGEALANLA